MGSARNLLVVGMVFLLSTYIAFESFSRLQSITSEKLDFLIDEEEGTTVIFHYSIDLLSNHSYKIETRLHDSGTVANVVGNIVIAVDGEIVRDEHLTAHQEDEHGNSRISATVEYWLDCENNCTVSINGSLEDGESWRVRIFKDLPNELETMAATYNIGLIGGGILAGVSGIILVVMIWNRISPPENEDTKGSEDSKYDESTPYRSY